MSATTTVRGGAVWPARDRLLPMLLAAAAVLTATWLLAVRVMTPGAPIMQPAHAEFLADVDRYAGLRRRVEGSMMRQQVTLDGTAIVARERALGAAMLAARPFARQGELFGTQAAIDFRRILSADLGRRSTSAVTGIGADVATTLPAVNAVYSPVLALPTFPPLLLATLPRLPDDLEYRFMANHLIIRDARANTIVDYLPNALTP
jgi:hypothetical protein